VAIYEFFNAKRVEDVIDRQLPGSMRGKNCRKDPSEAGAKISLAWVTLIRKVSAPESD
jgi:hypothetical protein